MAGVQWNGGGGGAAPAGTRYDPTRGGYVSIAALDDERRRREAEARGLEDRERNIGYERTDRALAHSQSTDDFRRQELMDATERQRYNDERDWKNQMFLTGRQDILEATGSGGGGGGGGEGGGSGGGGAVPTNPVTPVGPSPTGPTDAERAYYTRAKENTGRSLSAALKGLQSQMQRRGVAGSGIEARGLSDLFSAGAGDLAETDRALAEGGAMRSWQAAEAEKGRQWQSGENRLSRTQQATNSRLQALLSFYGTRY